MFDKDDFDFPAELHWQDSRDGLLRLHFVEREPEMLGPRQERILLPHKWSAVTSLMSMSLQHLTINGHILKERDIIFQKITAAARLYSTIFVTVCCYKTPLALQVANMLTETCNISRVETIGFHAQNTNSCIQLISQMGSTSYI